jgi:hypothetical protein
MSKKATDIEQTCKIKENLNSAENISILHYKIKGRNKILIMNGNIIKNPP